LSLFLLFAVKNYSKIGQSYRYPLSAIVLSNIVISLVLGLILYSSGVGQKADELSARHLNFYQKNIKITEIKKEIFLKKIKEIGITKDLLVEYPDLKEKLEDKFNETVLGKTYLENNKNCDKDILICGEDEINFSDEYGCGCKKIYK
jgi:cell shape-determining protein MreC